MNKGFSLVELIVVIAIMAILVGVAVPVYTSYISKAKESNDIQAIDNLKHACEIVSIEYPEATFNFGNETSGNTITLVVAHDNARARLAEILGIEFNSNTYTLTLDTEINETKGIVCPDDIG